MRITSTDRATIDTSFSVSNLGQYQKPFSRNIIWYGLGDSWCRWAHPRGMLKPNIFEIKLEEAKILKLSTLKDLEKFSGEFTINDNIDWPRVAQKWDGIEISQSCIDSYKKTNAPYLWLECWDVGSGCVWNGSAITESRRVPALEQQYKTQQGYSPP